MRDMDEFNPVTSPDFADPSTQPRNPKAAKAAPNLVPLYILAILALILSLVATALGVTLLILSVDREESYEWELEESAQEDDVTIADEYVIRSTTAISDAYKSGSTSGLSSQQKETLSMAEAVLSEIITEGMTDYEKEKAVYEWMTANLTTDDGMMSVVPTTNEDCDNPYGVLKYHTAVCVGYATTFRLFMQMMDIPCMVIHNSERYHSWDLVQLDGSWYHTDIYSDVGYGDSYAHFNLCDDMMTENWDRDYFPAADSLTYNVLYNTAPSLDSIYELPAKLREVYDAKVTTASYKLPNDDATLSYLYYILSEIDSRISDSAYMYWDSYTLEDTCLVTIQMERYEGGSYEYDPSISDDVLSKIYQSVEEAFGTIGQPVG